MKHVCICVTIINDFEREQGKVYENLWSEEKEGRPDVTIL